MRILTLFLVLFSLNLKARQNSYKSPKKSKKLKLNANHEDARLQAFQISYELNGFNDEQKEKMDLALQKLKIVLKSQEFKEEVLTHTFKGEKRFYKSKGMSNQEIYDHILKGVEDLSPVEDFEMDLKLTLYHSKTNTVGYTYPNTNEIWVNDKYFNSYSLGEVANNAMHEWLHKIGFEHSYYNNPDRPFTVPYAIGEIVEKLINNL
ncbi:MAG: hypothetical protein CME67_02315 [Halobacteriovoraceae bacterium]|nr:hypothetical protein [Halobacteriovoraceae bacterium]